MKAQRFSTLAVHAGEAPDPVTGASTPNLVLSTTFVAEAGSTFSVEGLTEDAPYFYTRWKNPTVEVLEKKLAALEGAQSCIAFASGMAAITSLFLHQLSPGDHLIISDVTYAAAAEITRDLFTRLGIRVSRVNLSEPEALRRALTDRTRLVFAETPCNPILRLTDIAATAEIAHQAGARLAVDSTFATPVATRPVELGADFVVHSLTKYLSGHGDAVGGALLGPADQLADLRRRVAIRTGGVLSPFNAWLINRGLATLPLRMRAHQEGAVEVARFLEAHPRVNRVVYPGLSSHPQIELARRQMKNFAGMIAFQVEDGRRAAEVLSRQLEVIHYAVSLGHHRSLIFYLPTDEMLENSFRLDDDQARAYREYARDGIFRLSVGIEDPADLCEDLGRALNAL
ncbi:MAG: aminotransferase class I/II-fold pyridoxal phosphate-dependent enzyme [Candidatus Glassbacteria bacterium]